MVVIEQKVVIGAYCCQATRIVVMRAPYLCDYVLGKRIFQELNQVVVVDHIQSVTAVQVFLKQEETHLIFCGDLIHILHSDPKDQSLCLLDASVHEAELFLDFVEQLNDQTGRLDHIQGSDEDVATTRIFCSVFNGFNELLSLLETHG